jgi:anti-sigma regulatory factor (Ser/Thr protein kinase)
MPNTDPPVSELVTNALETTVRHQLGTPIALRLPSNGRQALIEVWDADPTPPQAPALYIRTAFPWPMPKAARAW